MKILIDVTRLLDRLMEGRLPTGVDRVSLEYVRHFYDKSRTVIRVGQRTIVLPKSASQQIFRWVLQPPSHFKRKVILLVGRYYLRPNHNLAGCFLFNTGHTGLDKENYPEQLKKMHVRPIFFIHDLIPLTHPEYCRSGEFHKHEIRMCNALEVGAGIIANSQATLKDLQDFARLKHCKMPPAVVAPLAPTPFSALHSPRLIEAPYFVMLGTIEARKNHILILNIWRRLVETLGEKAPKLLIIGRRGWECENVFDMLERSPALKESVIELSDCSDEELASYLQYAQALLFPSFAEGYGLPLAEALQQGCPVIASDLPAFREIAADIPVYIDPLDTISWLNTIQIYSDNPSLERQTQVARISSFAPMTWNQHFAIVDQFLDKLS